MSNDEKLKWEGNGATPVEMITLTEAALHYVRAKQQARAEVIEEIKDFISNGAWTCSGNDYYQLKNFLTKLSEGNK